MVIIIIIILVAVTFDIIIIRHQPKSCYVVIQFVLSWTAKKMFPTKFLLTRGDEAKLHSVPHTSRIFVNSAMRHGKIEQDMYTTHIQCTHCSYYIAFLSSISLTCWDNIFEEIDILTFIFKNKKSFPHFCWEDKYAWPESLPCQKAVLRSRKYFLSALAPRSHNSELRLRLRIQLLCEHMSYLPEENWFYFLIITKI